MMIQDELKIMMFSLKKVFEFIFVRGVVSFTVATRFYTEMQGCI